jgi:rhodanese-related sulfurtransferase
VAIDIEDIAAMEDVMVFIQTHWMLCALFLFILGYVLFEEIRHARSDDRLSPQVCVNLMNREHALVWDIRSHDDFLQGHVVGAQSVALEDIDARYQKLTKLDRDKPLIVVCQAGVSAAKAAATLKRLGHQHVHILQGGIKQWQAEQLPLSKKGA